MTSKSVVSTVRKQTMTESEQRGDAAKTQMDDSHRPGRKKKLIKVSQAEAGGLLKIKNEEFFHGFLPKEHVYNFLTSGGDFLVRQASKNECRHKQSEEFMICAYNAKKGEVVEVNMSYSRTKRLFYVRKYCFETASGLIDYHRRQHVAIDDDETYLKNPIPKEDWLLNHEQIFRIRRLGEGAFGEVFMGTLRIGLIARINVAVKTFQGISKLEDHEMLFKEAMLMKPLRHPNIVQFVGIAMNESPVMMCMELAPGGSLLSAVQKQPGPSVDRRERYCYDTVKGLAYLEANMILHRDIAARNCLIGEKGEAKISDFGLSVIGAEMKEKKLKKVPIRYLAPEIFITGKYTHKSDIWAYGVLVWEVFHNGRLPYNELNNTKDIKQAILNGNRLKCLSTRFPAYLWKVCQWCWSQNPYDRPTPEQIIQEFQKSLGDEEVGFAKKLSQASNIGHFLFGD